MYYEHKSVSIYYEKHGNKKNSLIILPGWGDNRKSFGYIINSLKTKYTIYVFDYPGFGKSPIPKKDLTIYDYAEVFKSFLDDNDIKNPTILGHSFGGRITIILSSLYRIKFNKIVLISSAGIKPKKSIYKRLKQRIYKTLKKITKILPNKLRRKANNKLICIFGSRDYCSIPEGLRKTFLNIINEDLTKYLTNIKEEVLLIWGEKDCDTPLKDGYKMNKLIRNSGLIVVKNAHHFCYLECRDYINKILNEYLKNSSK